MFQDSRVLPLPFSPSMRRAVFPHHTLQGVQSCHRSKATGIINWSRVEPFKSVSQNNILFVVSRYHGHFLVVTERTGTAASTWEEEKRPQIAALLAADETKGVGLRGKGCLVAHGAPCLAATANDMDPCHP